MKPAASSSTSTPTSTPALPAPASGELARAWARLWERILAAQQASGRAPGSVRLLAVSKAFPAQLLAQAAGLGQRAFGENYAQEAIRKITALRAQPGMPELEWHFIGPIQSNKTRPIAAHFDWVQSIDRLAIAQRLAAQRPPELGPLQVLLEVNVSAEASKSGISEDRVFELADQLAGLAQLRLRGIMAIPAPDPAPARQHECFARLRRIFEQLQAQFAPAPLVAQATAAPDAAMPAAEQAPLIDTLSMGMSGDFEAAIAQGSTMVRVGSALFGERP